MDFVSVVVSSVVVSEMCLCVYRYTGLCVYQGISRNKPGKSVSFWKFGVTKKLLGEPGEFGPLLRGDVLYLQRQTSDF